MGVIDAPQWLLPAYVRSMKAVGATSPVEDLRAAGERLVVMWSSPDRHFHNLRHAIDLLARVDELADESHHPDIQRLAAWYHGCVFSAAHEQVYRRNGGEDEVASAAYAARDMESLGVPDKVTDRVCALILNLKRHDLPAKDMDASALNDADLGALAVEPQQYKRYRQLVRQEYAHIPTEDYLRGRLTIVSKLLARENLFSSPLGARWELPARENLEAERRHLVCTLDKLVGQPPQALVERERLLAAPCEPAASPAPGVPVEVPAPSTTTSSAGTGVDTSRPVPSPAAEPAPSPAAQEPAQVAQETVRAAQPLEYELSGLERERDEPSDSSRTARAAAAHSTDDSLTHTTSMESCIDELDRIMSTPRSGTPIVEPDAPTDRAAAAEAERLRLAERVRAKTEEARALRKARTGEFAPIQAEIIDDGASRL